MRTRRGSSQTARVCRPLLVLVLGLVSAITGRTPPARGGDYEAGKPEKRALRDPGASERAGCGGNDPRLPAALAGSSASGRRGPPGTRQTILRGRRCTRRVAQRISAGGAVDFVLGAALRQPSRRATWRVN